MSGLEELRDPLVRELAAILDPKAFEAVAIAQGREKMQRLRAKEMALRAVKAGWRPSLHTSRVEPR